MENLEKTTIINTENKSRENKYLLYFTGALFGFLSILALYTSISEGFFISEFLSTFLIIIVLGAISFMCFSPWKKINFLIGGIMVFSLGIWMFVISFNEYGDNFWEYLFWPIIFSLIGLSMSLRFFDTTLSQFIHKIIQMKAVRLAAKIMLWVLVIAIGLLIVTGIFSWMAGLSATTIIIVLLILIWLK